ncbi:MAG: hypothetical protein AAB739_03000 [Patescibacteria group bacterium]
MNRASEFRAVPPDMPQDVRNILEKLDLHSLATVAEIREAMSEPLSSVKPTDQEEAALCDYYGVSRAELGFFESRADAATDPDIAASLGNKLAQIEKGIMERMREKKIAEDPEAAARKGDVIARLRSMNPPPGADKDRGGRLIDALNGINRQ